MRVLSSYVQTLGDEKQECPSENQNQRLTPRRLHVDLNPVTAKIADVPETSEYTSVKQRPPYQSRGPDFSARSG
jgi:hypothetical protein